MRIIDTHCHLNDDKLYSRIDEVINSAKENGIVYMFNNGDSLESFQRIITISKEYKNTCFSVLGIHPEFALENDDYFSKAYSYIKEHRNEIKAIGEIGLDYHYSKDSDLVKKQKQRFIEQIRLAKELNLPIVIHSRDADLDTFNIIKEELPSKLDLHCYSSSFEMAKNYLTLPINFNIGIGGVVTFKNARVIKEVVTKIPLDHILTETDSPYLAPVPYRGKDNEPKYLPYIVKEIALLKNMPIEQVSETLFKNGELFYGL